ncbi:bifunctional ADP-dependent NAD(P)H-hydrate dehydratase/NAD(P)H-hydrate epimerase [Brevibacterium sp. LS14]|uniref:NAD(P)H-hydrate dehydratase n=1 Tax=Brevibacterium TaxID=1696 RepID=UPI001431D9E4|nr:bifunctional ADP-dependent NAD(P)H-hydrate dehydratase/NAD(P)H-hydrate epimerase [Brevibacterium sp. LS14]
MPTYAYPSRTVRDAEVPLLEAGVPLMARAAAALARFCAEVLRADRGLATGSRVCVLAGPGNNAGDALHAAAALARRGARVGIIRLFATTHEAGLADAVRAGADVIAADSDDADMARSDALSELARADLVLDGILGTGGRRGLPQHVARLIRDWRESDFAGTVIAVDMPSDLDPGESATGDGTSGPDSRVHADATLTFGGLKAELIDPRSARFTGPVRVVDIGLGLDSETAVAELLDSGDLAAEFPRPGPESHKYSRGVLGIVAGSREYPGAGVLTTGSAVNTGPGMVRFLGAHDVGERVLDRHAEVVLGPGRLDALVVGSGDPEAGAIETGLAAINGTPVPVVLDAGAIEMVGHAEATPVPGAAGRLRGRPVVLTPHAGELSRLLSRLLGEIITAGRVAADPLLWARRAAADTGHVVLLKGSRTVIACPDGFAVLPAPGPASLATAGSGDVLTGIIGTLLAAAQAKRRTAGEDGPMPDRAAAHTAGLGVLLHNAAGDLSINAEQLVTAVGQVTCALVHSGGAADGILVQ